MVTSSPNSSPTKISCTARRNSTLNASNLLTDESGHDQSLAAIVANSQHGDRAAQRRLYEACRGRVFRLARRMVGAQDAPDVAQQTFLQIFRTLQQFNGRSRFETWIYRVTVNEALQYLRRNHRRHSTLNLEPICNRKPPNDGDLRESLQQALDRIDPELRSMFLLRELENLSYSEIAAIMGIPEGTVGSRLNRARRELRRHLSALGI